MMLMIAGRVQQIRAQGMLVGGCCSAIVCYRKTVIVVTSDRTMDVSGESVCTENRPAMGNVREGGHAVDRRSLKELGAMLLCLISCPALPLNNNNCEPNAPRMVGGRISRKSALSAFSYLNANRWGILSQVGVILTLCRSMAQYVCTFRVDVPRKAAIV